MTTRTFTATTTSTTTSMTTSTSTVTLAPVIFNGTVQIQGVVLPGAPREKGTLVLSPAVA
eukprot:CAMPEP_0179098512 /NCGR_PEP_ID=MMETSP0796-20121207/45402_1 /TAXON_ID=73915 /ORGANISM="Pyrodinium bahamense, Strain pbaha01" /LENGTH=59 /DNA_ID=CAMNT_0020796293 /DNA_START=10 /DNA_END=189 /DNA_ORIENTATION=+